MVSPLIPKALYPRRSALIGVRLTPEIKAAWLKLCQLAGISISDGTNQLITLYIANHNDATTPEDTVC